MNDVESLLNEHLQSKAAAVAVVSRLDEVHTARAAASAQRPRFAPRASWVGAAAGLVAVAGAAGVVVNRASDSTPPAPTVSPGALPVIPGPTVNDHWHEAYGFWLCDRWVTLEGALEQPLSERFLASGIHSHDDGVIHIHPFSSAGSGPNATLGTFLAAYGVELTDDALRFPEQQGGEDLAMACDGEPVELTVTVWPDAADPGRSTVYADGLADIQLRDGAAMTIALTAGEPAPLPPAAARLDELGAIDTGAITTPGS